LAALRAARASLADRRRRAGTDSLRAALDSLDQAAARLESGGTATDRSLGRVEGDLAGLYDVVEGTDAAPTTQATQALARLERDLTAAIGRWQALEPKLKPARP
jgi:hypothetical protein